MRIVSLLLLVIIFALCYSGVSAENSTPTPILPVDQIKPGMKGVGKTVFSGDTIEEFQVEIIGVMRNIRPQGDIILAKLSGGPLEKTGLIAGMSGSPVYIDGKLIGAVAYGWVFLKDTITGITPIAEMLRVLDRADSDKKRRSASLPLRRSRLTAADIPAKRSPSNLVPIGTPIMASGVHPAVFETLHEALSPYGMFPVQAGNATGDQKVGELEPGSAVAVQLISGDMNLAAVGTLTYRDGDKILAFGHPFQLAGSTSMPLAAAYVHMVLPSQLISVKLSSAADVRGMVNQDRTSAVAGEIGSFARVVPCKVTVSSPGLPVRAYQYQLADSRFWTPMLAGLAMQNSILATEKIYGESTMKMKLTVQTAQRKAPIIVESIIYEPNAPLLSFRNITGPLQMLANNNIENATFESITLEVEMEDIRRTAKIMDIKASKHEVKRGESVDITVTLEPFEEKLIKKVITYTIPEDARVGQPIIITACEAQYSKMQDYSDAPGKFAPQNLDQLIRMIEHGEKGTDLILRLDLRKLGLTISGEELPSLPASMLNVMSGTGNVQTALMQENQVLRSPTKWVITGVQRTQVFVKE